MSAVIAAIATGMFSGSSTSGADIVTGDQAMQIRNAAHIRQLVLPCVSQGPAVVSPLMMDMEGNDIASTENDFEIFVPVVKVVPNPNAGFLSSKEKREIVPTPLPEVLGRIMPKEAVILNVVMAGSGENIRVFYTMP